jgi:signal transduction histidine kinase
MDQIPTNLSLDRDVVAALLELSYGDRQDWDTRIQHILRVDARVLLVQRVSYWRIREEGTAIVCEMAFDRGRGAFERGHILLAAEHPSYFAAIRGGTVIATDARSDPRTSSLREYLVARGIGAMLDFPIWSGGRVAGVLCHEHVGEAREWNASDVHFAGTVAQVVASSLVTKERALAERLASRSAFLDQTSRTLGESLDLEDVATRALGLLVPKLADGGTIDLYDEGALRLLDFAYVTAEGRVLLEKVIGHRPPGQASLGLSRNVAARRDAVLIPTIRDVELVEVSLAAGERELVRALGIQSAIGIPVFSGSSFLGTLTIFSQSRTYGNDDLRLVEDFGVRLGLALENARLHQHIRAAVRARDEFITLAAHELWTPVTSLLLSAEALVRRGGVAEPDEVVRTGERVLAQVRRLQRLIDQLLDWSRVTAKQLSLRLERADLAEIVRQTAEAFVDRFQRAGSTLTICASKPVVGKWDRVRLELMLASLLDNATKFGAGKPVDVSLETDGRTATLSVSDQGPGIPAQRLPFVFEAFERGVSAYHYGGLGLGLFVARAIAEAHGGQLVVDNREGEGATFTARLPIKTD